MKLKESINLKDILISVLAVVIISILGIGGLLLLQKTPEAKTEVFDVKRVNDEIVAGGVVASENETILHFQTGGKIIALPFKEGDAVWKGQTIAQLDTTLLKKQLQLMANNYQISKNNTDQTQEYEEAGILEGQQRISLDTSNKNSYDSITQAQVITDNVERIVNNALIAENSAQINVEIADYAITLSVLSAPINGTLVHSDISVPNVNITPATSFTVADLKNLIFKANVAETDILSIAEGTTVSIKLAGMEGKVLNGTVKKIYPEKIKLQTGENAYKVDVYSEEMTQYAKYGQSGTVLIKTVNEKPFVLVPTWIVLDGKYIWVKSNGKDEMRNIKIGKTIGNYTQIIEGLQPDDKIITEPQIIASKKYRIL